MGRKHRKREQSQSSKRARLHRRQALFAGLYPGLAHPSHIAFRFNRMGHPLYQRLIDQRQRRVLAWLRRIGR